MVSVKHNQPPQRVILLSDELAEFLAENCDANLRLGLGMLQVMMADEGSERKNAEKLVDMIEKFKKLKKAVAESETR